METCTMDILLIIGRLLYEDNLPEIGYLRRTCKKLNNVLTLENLYPPTIKNREKYENRLISSIQRHINRTTIDNGLFEVDIDFMQEEDYNIQCRTYYFHGSFSTFEVYHIAHINPQGIILYSIEDKKPIGTIFESPEYVKDCFYVKKTFKYTCIKPLAVTKLMKITHRKKRINQLKKLLL